MSFAMTERFKWIEGTPPQRLVGYMLADAYNDSTGRCDLSIASLIRLTSLAERTIQDAIKALECNGHLTRVYRTGTSTQYNLHPRDSRTPATAAPLPPQEMHLTPAGDAPKPEGTINITIVSPPKSEARKPEKQKRQRPAKEPTGDARHQPFIDAYCKAFEEATGRKYETGSWAADGNNLKRLLKGAPDITQDEWENALDWCWHTAPTLRQVPWESKHVGTLSKFAARWPEIVAAHRHSLYQQQKPLRR